MSHDLWILLYFFIEVQTAKNRKQKQQQEKKAFNDWKLQRIKGINHRLIYVCICGNVRLVWIYLKHDFVIWRYYYVAYGCGCIKCLYLIHSSRPFHSKRSNKYKKRNNTNHIFMWIFIFCIHLHCFLICFVGKSI
jgi:hypothetical protein